MLNRYVVVGWVLKEKLKEVVSHEILTKKLLISIINLLRAIVTLITELLR